MTPRLLISCDFDGTVTRQDTLVTILNAFGATDWHRVQSQVVSGTLSIREGLEKEMGCVKASEEELRALLRRRVEIEPDFPDFLKGMRAKGIPLVLLTGGFDLCVETVLMKTGLFPVPYLANRLKKTNGCWKVEFPYPSVTCSACGHCKGDPLRTWNARGHTTVFIGNGVTDRCGALEARITFAKDELADWCRKEKVSFIPYQTFTDVQQKLEEREWL